MVARTRQAGFTYLGLVIFVAIIGLVGAATLKIGSLMQRAANEEELLEIGAAYSAALQSYAAATPRGMPPQPPTLQELLKDPRFPGVRRHLRKIFVDPMTGKAEWGVVYLSEKTGVLAVHSLSQAKPLKIANFDRRFQNLDNKEKISDWKFMAVGQELAKVATPPSGAPKPAPSPTPAPAPPVTQPGTPPAPAPAEAPPPEPPSEEAPPEQTPAPPPEAPEEPQEPPPQPPPREG
jgi:type II secretory pathway pseudopilin PulG